MAPPRRPPSLGRWLRGKLLIATAVVIYLVSLAGTFYTLDIAYYQQEKWSLISAKTTSAGYMDNEAARLLGNAFTSWVDTHRVPDSPKARRDARFEESKRYARMLVDLSPSVTRVTLEDDEGMIMYEAAAPGRLERLNTLKNSLFDRRFERTLQRQFKLNESEDRVWRFRVHLTSPLHDPEVIALTSRYWRYVGIAFVLLTGVLLGLIRWVLGPLSRVTALMQQRGEGAAQFIPRPRSPVERSYNDLARDAALTRFSKELRELIATGGYSYAEPVLERAPALFEVIVGVEGCEIHTFNRRRRLPWRHDRAFTTAGPGVADGAFVEHLVTMLADADPAEKPQQWDARIHGWTKPGGAPSPFFCDVLSRSSETLWLLVVHRRLGEPTLNAWWDQFLARMAQELRYSLDSIEEQRRLILQEKSKANISLSRNLGHDLTNIIATSKLELMTVRTFLSLPADEISANPMKQRIFRESLEALLNNTRFLQEIVNLYRSFSFLQKPKFEEVNVSELVEDMVRLYRPSLSKDFEFELKLTKDLPPVRLEPRLLRLALFNLMTNATEAIRRASTDDKAKGRITLLTGFGPDESTVEVTVVDSGPGIRDAEGKLLSDNSLAEIFRLGYSTKKNQEGEGLGLNWVQSIVREFHGGEIIAANREEGGAAFTMRLPRISASSPSHEQHQKLPQTHPEDTAR
jgi:signal transduction histidine kinase